MNISKTKRRRLAGSHGLEAFFGKHAANLGKKLEKKLSPVLKPNEEMPDIVLILRLLGRHLTAQRTRVEDAEALYTEARVDARVARKERNAAEQEARRTFKQIRLFVTGAYAREDLEEIGLVGNAARRFFDFWRQGENLIAKLRRPGFRLPTPRFPGAEISPQDLADKLQPSADQLGDKIRAAMDAKRREEKARIRQKRALKDLETDYARLGQIATALCYFLDQDWLAKRTHTALRRMDRRPQGAQGDPSQEAPTVETAEAAETVESTVQEAAPPSTEPPVPGATSTQGRFGGLRHDASFSSG